VQLARPLPETGDRADELPGGGIEYAERSFWLFPVEDCDVSIAQPSGTHDHHERFRSTRVIADRGKRLVVDGPGLP
jgi:hypothetical protein